MTEALEDRKARRAAHFARMQAMALAPGLSAAESHEALTALARVSLIKKKRRLTRARKIIAAGYYYSGSGALLDFVADHEGAMSWPIQGEVRFINLPWGVNDLYENVHASGQIDAHSLVRLYLHLHGKMPINAFGGNAASLAKVANRTNRQAIRSAFGKAHGFAVKEAIAALVAAVGKDRRVALPILSKLFQRYDSELRRLSGASIIAYDRAIPPQALERSVLLGRNSAIVAVHRDPRSQFVDITKARADRGQSTMTAEEFIEQNRSRRRRARSYALKHSAQFDDIVAFVSFEELVTSEAMREKLRELLGLSDRPYTPQRFLPEVSQKNITNYEKHPDQASIRQIEEALPEYLWPTGDKCGSYFLKPATLNPLP